MKDLYFRKIKMGLIFISFISVLVLSSCMTTQKTSQENGNNSHESAKEQLKPKEQNLSDEELEDIALWKSNEQRIFVQNHSVPSDENGSRAYNPWTASYEGFRMASLFGFDKDFSTDEMYQFIQAMFSDMPEKIEIGSLVKSIIIAKWYDDGSPLVINLTRAFIGNKIPAVIYMFNTWDNLRKYGLSMIKKAGVALSTRG